MMRLGATMDVVTVSRLSKHHGLGNDFVVAVASDLPPDAAGLARRLCDRRTGIGADGLVFGLIGGQAVSMRLFNCDGSEAEVSGNGLRCLAQAVARMRSVSELDLEVSTAAGVRRCVLHGPADDAAAAADAAASSGDAAAGAGDTNARTANAAPHTVIVSVEMGDVGPGPAADVDDPLAAAAPASAAVVRWATAAVGNPHVVCQVPDPDAIDIAAAGAAVEAHFSGGVNVHFAAVSGADEITARVWERGVGVTDACGSGAVVIAACFRDWGLVGERTEVRMPGGVAQVDLSAPVTLTGPATHVADLDVSGV